MRRRAAVQRDRLRSASLSPDCLREERLCSRHVAPGAEAKIDRLSRPVNGAVEIGPFAANLHVGLVDAPRPTGCRGRPVPAFDELRRVALHPTQDRRVCQRQAAFGHHLDKIAQTELVAQIPTYAKDDDFAVEMTAVEQPLQIFQLAHWLAIVKSLRLTDRRIGIAPQPFRVGAPENTVTDNELNVRVRLAAYPAADRVVP